jgi:hypothetical protein
MTSPQPPGRCRAGSVEQPQGTSRREARVRHGRNVWVVRSGRVTTLKATSTQQWRPKECELGVHARPHGDNGRRHVLRVRQEDVYHATTARGRCKPERGIAMSPTVELWCRGARDGRQGSTSACLSFVRRGVRPSPALDFASVPSASAEQAGDRQATHGSGTVPKERLRDDARRPLQWK